MSTLHEGVWTIPHGKLHDPLPPIRELLREHGGQRTLQELNRVLFGDDGTPQTELVQKTPEAQLEAFVAADQWALPATEDRADYFGQQHISYWLNGLGDYLFLTQLLAEQGIDRASAFRFLDFACSSGRVLRHFLAHSPAAQAYGTDLYANPIRWARSFLPARGVFFQNSVVPSLPLEDGSIDLIFCGSIFTHLDEFETSWLLELRRVLRPGGRAFVSFQSERCWAELRPGNPVFEHLTKHPYGSLDLPKEPVTPAELGGPLPRGRVVLRYVPAPLHNMHTFHSTDYVRANWGRLFELDRIVPRSHGPHQEGAVLIKR